MKQRCVWVLVALSAMGMAPAESWSSMVYSVQRTIGSGSVIGTLTTDGSLGALVQSNITAWSLTLNSADGTGDLLINSGNSEMVFYGNGLSATAAGLFFDFSGTGDSVRFQYPNQNSGNNFWCFENDPVICGAGPAEFVARVQGSASAARTGLVEIGKAESVPEPGTLALLGLGLAGLGLSRRRKAN